MRDVGGRYGKVLLLGGTSELGLAILAALDLQPEAEVILAGRDLAAMEAASLPADVRRRCLHWDARDLSSGQALLGQVLRGGDLDLVIAAAGILGDDPRNVLMTNLVGLVDILTPLGDVLRLQRHGTIVVLSSIAGIRARKSNFVYGASKAGLDAFANGLADQLAPEGVRVLVVRPGFVRGRMTEGLAPAPFSTTPEAVASVVQRALGTSRTVAWAPPVLQVVAPLLRVIPRSVWRRLKM